jgi:hypothetical protein
MPDHSADEWRALSQAHSIPGRNICGVCLRRYSTQDQSEAAAQAWRSSSFLVIARHPTCESSVTRRGCLCEQPARGVWYASLEEDARRLSRDGRSVSNTQHLLGFSLVLVMVNVGTFSQRKEQRS